MEFEQMMEREIALQIGMQTINNIGQKLRIELLGSQLMEKDAALKAAQDEIDQLMASPVGQVPLPLED